MEFIFKSSVYEREYKDLLKILPTLNQCGLCMKLKCENCKNTYSIVEAVFKKNVKIVICILELEKNF